MSSEFGRTTFGVHHDRSTDGNEHAFPNGPYFSFRQDFSNGNCFEGVSYGRSRFTEPLDHRGTSSQPVFSVHKTCDPLNITVSIQSETLAQALKPFGLDLSRICNVLPVFEHFTTIHTMFMDRRRRGSVPEYWPESIRELGLFVVDFLLDEAIFSDAEKIRPGSVSPAIRSRMQRRKALLDTDHLERALDHAEQRTAPGRKGPPDALDNTESERPIDNFGYTFSLWRSSFPEFDLATHLAQFDGQALEEVLRRTFRTIKLKLDLATFLAQFDGQTLQEDGRRTFGTTELGLDLATYLAQSDGQTLQEDGRRWKLVSNFRKYFHTSFSTLKQHRTSDVVAYPGRKPNELSRLRIPPDPRSAWKDGIRVIRHLIRGRLPQTVEQVIFCIMTANAMQTETNSYSCAQEEFVRDLDRWRDVVPVKDRHLFEQVVYLLWGQHLNKTRRAYQSDNLFHFQELFQNLLSETGIEEFESDWHGGTRLSVIQACHTEGSWTSANTQPGSVSTPDMDMSTHRSEIYKGNWNAHDFEVIKLASTVIFCLVIAVLLFLYHPVAHAQATLLLQKIPCQGSELSVVHKRNCILLACYLGLSTHTIENIPFDDGVHPQTPRPCCLCGERGTKSNAKRHQDKHKREKKYGCHYCKRKFSRKDNRVTHEKNCPMRLGEPDLTGDSFGTRRPPPAAERSLGTGWPETSQPATLDNFGLNGDWSAMGQPLAVLEETDPSVERPGIGQPATVVLAGLPGNSFATAQTHPVQREMNFGRGLPYMEQPALPDLSSSIGDWFGTAGPAAAPEQPNSTLNWSGMTPSTGSYISDFTALHPFMTGQAAAAPAQTNLAMDPSAITTAGSCNLYSGAQHPFVPGQSPVALERLDHSMNPWGLGQHFAGHGELGLPENGSGSGHRFAGQGAYASKDRSYSNTRPKRKAPSSPTDARYDRVKRAKGGSARQNVCMTASCS